MPTEQLRVEIRLRDFMTRRLKKIQGTVNRFAAGVIGKFRAIGAAVFSLKSLLLTLAGAAVLVKVTNVFIRTAAEVENMRITLQGLMGDISEANKLFDDLATFAGKVPFELEEIMKVGVMFAGVFKGGREEIVKMMPLVADIAAMAKPFGIGFEAAGRQLSRMFTAGAAAADQFRDAGILAMLGFQQGVAYTAEETKAKVISEWEKTGSMFRGTAQKLATTWDGQVSMMWDSWFTFKKRVMEAGVFEFMKEGLRVFSEEVKAITGRPEEFAEGAINAFEGIAIAAGIVASGVKVLGVVFVTMGIVAKAAILGLKSVVFSLIFVFQNLMGLVADVFGKLKEAPGPVVTAIETILGPIDGVVSSLRSAEETMKGWVSTVGAGMKTTHDDLTKMAEKLDDLRTGIPHEEVANFFKKIREGLEVRKDLEGLTAQYLKLREINEELFEGEDVKAFRDSSKELAEVVAQFAKHGERGAEALALARKQAEGVTVAMGGAAETTGKVAEKAEEVKDALVTATDPSRLDEFNEKMQTWKNRFDEVKSAAMAVGGILVDNIMRSIDAAIEGTFNWRKALQETAKDLAKMLLRQALMAAVQFGAGALAGAAAGPRPGPGGPMEALPGTEVTFGAMRRGGVLGGFPSAQRGMLFNGDQLVRVGDNMSGREAGMGVFPIARGRHGRLGVEAVGAQPAPTQVNFNINAIDSRGVEGWLFENRHKMADMTGLSRQEGRAQKSSF